MLLRETEKDLYIFAFTAQNTMKRFKKSDGISAHKEQEGKPKRNTGYILFLRFHCIKKQSLIKRI